MSDITDPFKFTLNGEIVLGCSYDEEADILYLWPGDEPRPGVAIQTPEGHLVRFDPDTRELVGITIFDWHRTWRELGRIEFHAPEMVEDRPGRWGRRHQQSRSERREYILESVG